MPAYFDVYVCVHFLLFPHSLIALGVYVCACAQLVKFTIIESLSEFKTVLSRQLSMSVRKVFNADGACALCELAKRVRGAVCMFDVCACVAGAKHLLTVVFILRYV